MFRFELVVTPRKGARDPQAEAISAALRHSDFPSVTADSVGRYLHFSVSEPDEEQATAIAHQVCQQLLVNPSLETYVLRAVDAHQGAQRPAKASP